MAGFPMLAVEVTNGSDTIYLSTHSYYSGSDFFQPRLIDDVEFDRSVGCVLWGSRSRGEQNFGVIRVANADGAFDSLVGTSLRDESVIIKRGESLDAYGTFATVATLIVDRVEFTDELVMSIYVTDISAKLERALQSSVYPSTVSNAAVRGQPRPITFGCCYQVPFVQPNAYGNGYYDLHDNDQWIGVEQVLDQGSTLTEGTGYERATVSGIYGIERLTAPSGKQCATVLGAFKVASTEITEDFASLASWTETNGGVAGRDVSIVSNACNIVNTAGGATLSIAWNGSTPTGTDATYWYYEFNCTAWVSGYAELRTEAGAATQRRIDAAGRYTGIIRASGNVVPAFYAPNGSNCSLTIDAFRLRKVTPMTGLSDCIKFLATNDATTGGHGPLTTSDLDTTSISDLETDAPYDLGFYVQTPVQIADMLDQVMASFGGWWYVNRLGKIAVGRLESPVSSSQVMAFDQTNIAAGMRISFDEAKGLSNRALGKRNWQPYQESELAASLQYVQLNASDKDADVTLSAGNYAYSAAALGSVRSTPLMAGSCYYFEVSVSAVASTQHMIGVGSSAATITNYPGATANSMSLRANGNSIVNGSATAYGTGFVANDVVGVAIDGRSAAYGSSSRGFRLYVSVNGVWQASADPDLETGFIASAANSTAIAYAMLGGNFTGTNSGAVNFGQSSFSYDPPADYIAPAWHRALVQLDYRESYQSSTALAASYEFASASEAAPIVLTADRGQAVAYTTGIPTWLSANTDLEAECDRWCALYAQEAFFYQFDVFLDAEDADELLPGDLVEISYSRFGLSSKPLRVVGVKGRMLDRRVTLTCWG